MSDLPTNIADLDEEHTAGHNATNAQVNINSRPATVQTVTHSSAGTLTIDAHDGHSVRIDTQANVTGLTINNLDDGLRMRLIFEIDGTARTLDLSDINIDTSNTILSITADANGTYMVDLVELSGIGLWAPDGLRNYGVNTVAAERLTAADVLLFVDPADSSTWGRDRSSGQWIVAGNRFNPGGGDDINGPLVDPGGTAGTGTREGYDLSFNTAGDEIDGDWTMNNGESRRLYAGTVGSIPVIVTGTQWVEDSTYDPANNTGTGPGNNTGLAINPTDPIFYDGTRNQLAFITDSSELFEVGPSGDVIRVASAFQVEAWMDGNDWTTGPSELHSPGNHTSPILMQIINGNIRVNSKDATAELSSGSPNPNTDVTHMELALPTVGEWFAFILDFKVDPGGAGFPGGGSGYINFYTIDPTTGVMTTELATTADYGYRYDGSVNNDEFYLMAMQNYNFHQYTPGATNNWDNVGGDVRGYKTPTFVADRGTGVTIEQFADHLRAVINAPKP